MKKTKTEPAMIRTSLQLLDTKNIFGARQTSPETASAQRKPLELTEAYPL